MNSEINRLKTFKAFKNNNVSKEELACLGFFFYRAPDVCKCFYCGVEIFLWKAEDVVSEEHQKYSGGCGFMRREFTGNIPLDPVKLDALLPPKPTPDVYGSRTEDLIDEISALRVTLQECFNRMNYEVHYIIFILL